MVDVFFASWELVLRELALFAAVGFLILGISDLLIDLIWIGGSIRHRLMTRKPGRACVTTLPAPAAPGRLAIFVPAWDEAEVIRGMLGHALNAFGGHHFRIYVGCYPNDPATIAAVRAIEDPRVRLVVGTAPGPTTKADCLNRIWEAMAADEAAERQRFKAVILHDAEDVVHSSELAIFDSLIERFDLVQLPVLPLSDPDSRWVAGHYGDEFAESHGKELLVREWLGAALPSAGVGCALSREALDALAARGAPFDAESLTEDYELGLRLRGMGRRSAFVRLPRAPGGQTVSTRGHFPASLDAAVGQKARWMTGIALSGWDRLGWSGGIAERWMRLRDRQSLLSALLLASAYVALVLWTALAASDIVGLRPLRPFPPALSVLLAINAGFLAWRLTLRFGFVSRAYGWREGLQSLPRVIVGNAIAILAARRALLRYLSIRRTGSADWHKTAHIFPRQLPAE